ncbi:hypothetical protein D9756_010699 [Leucocoprinus leucothites]|uniref:Aromatic prenyltransferase n=1 Tax=Leucocoprinus leucothites TaxID=201217 RepID=A0A8H5CUY1_9AGAR|nr:hypothetical protein D9756_010699 [Leucoagaricus leucothites]
MTLHSECLSKASTGDGAKGSDIPTFGRSPAHCTSNNTLVYESESPPRSAFWNQEIGRGLQYLFERVSLPTAACHDFMDYFNHQIAPLLGPTPQEFKEQGMRPSTFFSDDHTPVELIWAVEADGKMSIRFAMEPLNCLNGTPSPSRVWMSALHNLCSWHRTRTWSLEWADICRETLIIDDSEVDERIQYPSHFFLGGDFSQDSMVGKLYFLPHFRATKTEVSQEDLVTECISRIGLTDPWSRVLSFMSTIPKNERPVPDMVAIDCMPSTQNRIKVYFRCDVTSLDEVIHIVRLGGALDNDPLIKEITDLIEELWGHFFPGLGRFEHITPSRPRKLAHGFLIYFEMKLGSNRMWPKVYFPVRQYCESDTFIANAISKFYAPYNDDFSKRYLHDLHNILWVSAS